MAWATPRHPRTPLPCTLTTLTHSARHVTHDLHPLLQQGEYLKDLWRLDVSGGSSPSSVSVKATLLDADAPAPGRFWTNGWMAGGKL